MKLSLLIIIPALLLTSCWTVYRQVDAGSTPLRGTDQKIILHQGKLGISLLGGHTRPVGYDRRIAGDYHVMLSIWDVPKGSHALLSNVRISLADHSDTTRIYDLFTIRLVKVIYADPGNTVKWVPISDPPITPGQVFDLSGGEYYILVYSFKGSKGRHRSRLLKADLEATVNGETISQTVYFKKGKMVELLH